MLSLLLASAGFFGGAPGHDPWWVKPVNELLPSVLQDDGAEPEREDKPVSAVPA